jgi:site-specific recombinase XerD
MIDRYRRHLKRRNVSPHTIKNYLSRLSLFTTWLTLPIEEVTKGEIGRYIDHLLKQRLSAQTITSHLQTIRLFFEYLITEEQLSVTNPITKVSIRLPKPLPRHLKDDQVHQFLRSITDARDTAICMLMLRCGLRVEEVAHLTLDAVELSRNRLFIAQGKGGKDRVVYLSKDARAALEAYLATRASKSRRVFLVQKGPWSGTPLSVRGIQKRIEYYARESKVKVSCHSLRHTMATQLLNADADISTIQDLLGHTHITTTQRYCSVSNAKAQRDYDKAIEIVIQRTVQQGLVHTNTEHAAATKPVLVLRTRTEEKKRRSPKESLDRSIRLVQSEDAPSKESNETGLKS